MSEWIVGRGRALARVARGEGGDALSATLQALPVIIDGLRSRGFEFKRVDELIR